MIEMLGVLALVGVLSVGGIAGYSKAMWMYKTNKQAEQFGVILRALFNNKEQFNLHKEGYTTVIPLLQAMGELPDEMIIPNNDFYIQDSFGLRYEVYYGAGHRIRIRTILPSSKDNANICKNLYTIVQKFSHDIWATEIITDGKYLSHAYGDKYCTSDRKCLKDLAPHDIDSLCRVCDGDDSCQIYFIISDYN